MHVENVCEGYQVPSRTESMASKMLVGRLKSGKMTVLKRRCVLLVFVAEVLLWLECLYRFAEPNMRLNGLSAFLKVCNLDLQSSLHLGQKLPNPLPPSPRACKERL